MSKPLSPLFSTNPEPLDTEKGYWDRVVFRVTAFVVFGFVLVGIYHFGLWRIRESEKPVPTLAQQRIQRAREEFKAKNGSNPTW